MLITMASNESTVVKGDWSVVLRFNATLTAKFISWWSVTYMCFLAFSHQYLHKILSKATTTFLMCFSRESKICQKEISPKPGLELSTTRSPLSQSEEAKSKVTWMKNTIWTKRVKRKTIVCAYNFSFSHSVFKRLVLQPRRNQRLFGKGLKGI